MSNTLNATLRAIAQKHLDIDTLEKRNSSHDFHDLAVWEIEAALAAAYEAGRAAATAGKA